MYIMNRIIETHAPAATILIRILVGSVFLSEGIQKFLYPDQVGIGRFAKIGMPGPELLAPFVGAVEIVAGLMILLGLYTRLAGSALAAIMAVAIISTKIPILLGYGYWGFQLRDLSRYGFWAMAHEARTDFSMLFGALFLVIVGGGLWSLDAVMARVRNYSNGNLLRKIDTSAAG